MNISSLRKRNDFVRMNNSSTKSVQEGLILISRKNDINDGVRIGYIVTKKLGNAPQRNRIKRRLRDIVSKVIPQCGKPGYDYLIIGRKVSLDRDYNLLNNDLKRAITDTLKV